MTQIAYQWQPIEDLPKTWSELVSSDLESLASIWKTQAAKLKESDTLKQFNERLCREWAIETGILENLYSIDRGTTQLLIEKGLEASLLPHGSTNKPVEFIIAILKDQKEALEYLFAFVSQKRELSTSYIKELHQVLTQHQETAEAVDTLGRLVEVPLLRGQWKQYPNNPTRPDKAIHEYCPPVHVPSEIDCLLTLHRNHVENEVPPEVEAAWLHHRFTQIHPFQDGNGRVVRALASLIFLRAGWFPLVVHRDNRDEYIAALEDADNGDLSPLVRLFSKIQKKAFVRALSLSESVLHEHEPLQQLISAGIERLRTRKQQRIQQMQSRAFELSQRLEELAEEKLKSVALTLNNELQDLEQSYFAEAKRNDDDTDFWFRQQIIKTAKALDYYADTRTYRAWIRLKIKEERQTELVLSFHALGFEFLGIMAASAFIEYRDKTENSEITGDGPRVICDEVFQFSYNEQEDAVIQRFQEWLNDVLIVGIDQWRKQL
jgi:Fic family protein